MLCYCFGYILGNIFHPSVNKIEELSVVLESSVFVE